MSIKRIRSKSKNVYTLNNARESFLLHGQDLFCESEQLGFIENDIKMLKKLWVLHQHCIMNNWKSDKAHKGKRPWAWWRFEQNMDIPQNEYNYLLEHDLLESWDL